MICPFPLTGCAGREELFLVDERQPKYDRVAEPTDGGEGEPLNIGVSSGGKTMKSISLFSSVAVESGRIGQSHGKWMDEGTHLLEEIIQSISISSPDVHRGLLLARGDRWSRNENLLPRNGLYCV